MLLAALGIPAFSQITLTQANYPLPADTVTLLDVTSQVTSNPSIGANQTWNYSALTLASATAYSNIYIPVSGDANFPAAQFYVHNVFKGLTSSLGYYIDQYYSITASGAQAIGFHVPAQAYGLGALTGNNSDTLYVLDNILYTPTNPRPVVAFPATAGSAWHSSVRYVVNMALTVSSASLNNTPLAQAFYFDRNDSVVGWGTLQLPAQAGFNTNIPVLQDMTTQYCLDSFYLNGSPAPTSITTAFGITQGQKTGPIYNRVELYRAGSFNYQMLFNYTDNTFSTLYSNGGSYVNTQLPLSTGINDITADEWSAAYPNPMNGRTFDIRMYAGTAVSAVIITDLSGRVADHITTANKDGIIHVQTNTTLADGLYIYKVLDANSNVVSTGKIVSAK